MNAPIKTLRTRPPTSFAGLLLLVSTLAGVGGCADLRRSVTLPPVNPESPVAPAVAAASVRTFARPRLSDVPPAPKNVPSAPTLKLGVAKLVGCRRGLYAYAAAHPQMTHGADMTASDLREVARVNPADAPPPDSAARSDELAARLRAFAAPPAAIGSGPAPTASQGKPPEPGAPPVPTPAPKPAAAAPPAPTPSVAAPAAAPGGSQTREVVDGPPPPPLPQPLPDPLVERCS